MTAAEFAGLRGADRRRPWRPYGRDFAEVVLPPPTVTLCSPEEGEWRWEMQQAICREAKYDYDYPFDGTESFLWKEGQGLLFAVEGKLYFAVIQQAFVAAYRKRYWLKFASGQRLTIIEKQLNELMKATVAQFIKRIPRAIVPIAPVECKAIVVWTPGYINAKGMPPSLAATPVSPPPSIPPVPETECVLSSDMNFI